MGKPISHVVSCHMTCLDCRYANSFILKPNSPTGKGSPSQSKSAYMNKVRILILHSSLFGCSLTVFKGNIL